MNNFIFENKTKVYFGKDGVKEYLGNYDDYLEKKRREYLRRQKYLREHPEARRTSRPSASGTPARTPARKTSAGTSAKGATARPAARKPSAQAGRGTARPSSGTGAKRTQPPRGKDGFGRR